MMQKFRLFILFFSVISTLPYVANGQDDKIKKEILEYNNSTSELISKGRRLLLDYFIDGNNEKVKDITSYLTEDINQTDYIGLFPNEEWLLYFWLKDYDKLLAEISRFNSGSLDQYQRKIQPLEDGLFEKIMQKSQASSILLEAYVSNSDLSDHDKNFLLLLFKYLIADQNYPGITQEMLNNEADQFLSDYPNSKFESFVRDYIRYKFIQSKWGFVAEFFTGYGFLTDDLKEKYQNTVPIGVAFDIYYKNFVLYLRDFIGFSFTNKDIPYNTGVWDKHSQVRVFIPEASIGYIINDSKRFKIAPFLGVSSVAISPTEYDLNREPDLDKVDLSFTTTYTMGMNLDIKLTPSNISMITNGPENSYWFIRLRYSYNMPQFPKKYPDSFGNIHTITIGFGGFGSRLKRDY